MELEAARGWESLLRNLAPRNDLAQRYLALRGYLVPLVLHAPALQDALFWLTRHLRALRLYGPPAWPDDGTDHGALKDRCLHVLEVLGDSLEQAPPEVPVREVSRWLYELVRLLEVMPSETVARFLAEACAFPSVTSS
jgi:hypothetical protein